MKWWTLQWQMKENFWWVDQITEKKERHFKKILYPNQKCRVDCMSRCCFCHQKRKVYFPRECWCGNAFHEQEYHQSFQLSTNSWLWRDDKQFSVICNCRVESRRTEEERILSRQKTKWTQEIRTRNSRSWYWINLKLIVAKCQSRALLTPPILISPRLFWMSID